MTTLSHIQLGPLLGLEVPKQVRTCLQSAAQGSAKRLSYPTRSTIITTNLDYDEWHNFLGNKALCEALLSRLRHKCHTIRIDGPSLREPSG
jgi:IstB-like ATP binding protein